MTAASRAVVVPGVPRRATPAGAVSLREALRATRVTLGRAGCATPRLDAEILLAHALGTSRERLVLEDEHQLEPSAARVLEELVHRRADLREPVAYLVGRRAFRHLELAVDRRALVPRGESELLVEVALGLPPGARVIDVGTGSGAVALALKHERADLALSGSDISAGALELARANARRLGLAVRWLRADLLHGVADQFDALLANLPYVAERERARLAPEITRHEPPAALFAGGDGLALIRRLLGSMHRHPSVRFLALEVGAGQAPAVARMITAVGFERARSERDLAGIERVLVAERELV